MHNVVLLLVCLLACAGHAWRVRPSMDSFQGNPDVLAFTSSSKLLAKVGQSKKRARLKSTLNLSKAIQAFFLALNPADVFNVAAANNPPSYKVRLARRHDLLPASGIVERAFSVCERYGGKVEAMNATERSKRGWLEVQTTRLRIAWDVEQRMTPWDWKRHAQVVAEDAMTGSIIGFAEVWGEDFEALNNASAKNPQPVLFNLCVSNQARGRGVARGMLAMCEDQVRGWGDSNLWLQVRGDNEAACKLYESAGFEFLETRAAPELAAWRDRWKGGALPLRLMRKSIAEPSETVVMASASAQQVSTRDVDLKTVLAYSDSDALMWFVLRAFRYKGQLSVQNLRYLVRIIWTFGGFFAYAVFIYILALGPDILR